MSTILSRPQRVNTNTTTAVTTNITATNAAITTNATTTSATTTSAIAATHTATDAAFEMFAYYSVNWFPRYPDTQNTYVIIIAQRTCGCQW